MDSYQETLIEMSTELINAADSLIITAGAGMGVDSGMPDFRGQKGFWNTYPALAHAKIPFQKIACPEAFHENPGRAWGFYGHRLAMYRQLQPHAGFALLKKWGENRQQGYRVFTSNVDGHFQKAGFNHDAIYECHGSIHHLQCLKPCCEAIWPADAFNPEVDAENCLLLNPPPLCPHCGALARPNILMFDDWGWNETRSERQFEQLNHWLDTIHKPVIIEIGAGTAIPSVRLFGEQLVRQRSGKMIRINLREPEIKPRYGIGLAMSGLDALMAIEDALRKKLGEAFDRTRDFTL